MIERNKIHLGDCLEVLKTLPDASVDCIVTDPPYGLGTREPTPEEIITYLEGTAVLDTRGDFMGRNWSIPPVPVWKECFRVLKPGEHLLSFAGTRTFDLISAGIRMAGFENRDTVASFFGTTVLSWTYGCLSDDTEILIDGKWEHYSPSLVGRRALCYDVNTDTYSWGIVEGSFVYDYEDTAFRIQSDSTDQIVSRNHRCLVEQGGEYLFRFAEELSSEVRVPVLENLQGVLNSLFLPNLLKLTQRDLLENLQKRASRNACIGQTSCAHRGTKGSLHSLCSLQETSVEAECLAEEHNQIHMLAVLQRATPRQGVGSTWAQRFSSSDAGRACVSYSENEGGEEPFPKTRELQSYQVRPVSGSVSEHVSQGRVCDGAPFVGGSSFGAATDSPRGGSSCKPQPTGQSIVELADFCVQPRSQTIRASRYTRSDLARVSSFHLKGKVWCVQVPTGAFVARRNGKVFVTGNSGFPKSLNIAKAIDKSGGRIPDFDLQRKIAKEIRRLRQVKGWSQQQLADHFPYAEVTKNWEREDDGFRVPSVEDCKILSEVLGLSPEFESACREADQRQITGGTGIDRRQDGTVIGLGHSGVNRESTSSLRSGKAGARHLNLPGSPCSFSVSP